MLSLSPRMSYEHRHYCGLPSVSMMEDGWNPKPIGQNHLSFKSCFDPPTTHSRWATSCNSKWASPSVWGLSLMKGEPHPPLTGLSSLERTRYGSCQSDWKLDAVRSQYGSSMMSHAQEIKGTDRNLGKEHWKYKGVGLEEISPLKMSGEGEGIPVKITKSVSATSQDSSNRRVVDERLKSCRCCGKIFDPGFNYDGFDNENVAAPSSSSSSIESSASSYSSLHSILDLGQLQIQNNNRYETGNNIASANTQNLSVNALELNKLSPVCQISPSLDSARHPIRKKASGIAFTAPNKCIDAIENIMFKYDSERDAYSTPRKSAHQQHVICHNTDNVSCSVNSSSNAPGCGSGQFDHGDDCCSRQDLHGQGTSFETSDQRAPAAKTTVELKEYPNIQTNQHEQQDLYSTTQNVHKSIAHSFLTGPPKQTLELETKMFDVTQSLRSTAGFCNTGLEERNSFSEEINGPQSLATGKDNKLHLDTCGNAKTMREPNTSKLADSSEEKLDSEYLWRKYVIEPSSDNKKKGTSRSPKRANLKGRLDTDNQSTLYPEDTNPQHLSEGTVVNDQSLKPDTFPELDRLDLEHEKEYNSVDHLLQNRKSARRAHRIKYVHIYEYDASGWRKNKIVVGQRLGHANHKSSRKSNEDNLWENRKSHVETIARLWRVVDEYRNSNQSGDSLTKTIPSQEMMGKGKSSIALSKKDMGQCRKEDLGVSKSKSNLDNKLKGVGDIGKDMRGDMNKNEEQANDTNTKHRCDYAECKDGTITISSEANSDCSRLYLSTGSRLRTGEPLSLQAFGPTDPQKARQTNLRTGNERRQGLAWDGAGDGSESSQSDHIDKIGHASIYLSTRPKDKMLHLSPPRVMKKVVSAGPDGKDGSHLSKHEQLNESCWGLALPKQTKTALPASNKAVLSSNKSRTKQGGKTNQSRVISRVLMNTSRNKNNPPKSEYSSKKAVEKSNTQRFIKRKHSPKMKDKNTRNDYFKKIFQDCLYDKAVTECKEAAERCRGARNVVQILPIISKTKMIIKQRMPADLMNKVVTRTPKALPKEQLPALVQSVKWTVGDVASRSAAEMKSCISTRKHVIKGRAQAIRDNMPGKKQQLRLPMISRSKQNQPRQRKPPKMVGTTVQNIPKAVNPNESYSTNDKPTNSSENHQDTHLDKSASNKTAQRASIPNKCQDFSISESNPQTDGCTTQISPTLPPSNSIPASQSPQSHVDISQSSLSISSIDGSASKSLLKQVTHLVRKPNSIPVVRFGSSLARHLNHPRWRSKHLVCK